MLLKHWLILLLCTLCPAAYSGTYNKFQTESMTLENIKHYTVTKQAIVLNTLIDDVQQLDPRLKSIIMYAHYESNPVYIYYYSEDSKRYTMKLLELFKANKVNSVTAEIKLSTNLMEHNLIKIYLGESQNAI